MATVEPFDVAFPVNFYSNGDTTTQAFGKHIQEIKRIYGVINSVNADKVSAAELTSKFTEINNKIAQNNTALSSNLQTHINSTNPHPNYKPSLSFSDISGKLETSKLTGRLPIRVVEPNTFVADDPDETVIVVPKGIDGYSLGGNGFVKFGNGMIIQWGWGASGRVNFPIEFPNVCYVVIGGGYMRDNQTQGTGYGGSYNGNHVNDWDRKGFGCNCFAENVGDKYISYVAFGR